MGLIESLLFFYQNVFSIKVEKPLSKENEKLFFKVVYISGTKHGDFYH